MLLGFDAVSQFQEHGKPNAWKVWEIFWEVTDVFIKLFKMGDISAKDKVMIEHFTVILYDRTCQHKTVKECWKYLFTKMNCMIAHPHEMPCYNMFVGKCYS